MILDSPPYRSALYEFLCSHGGVEKLNFLSDEKTFQQIPPTDTVKLKSDSQNIYGKYVKTPLWESNKGETVRKNIEEKLGMKIIFSLFFFCFD